MNWSYFLIVLRWQNIFIIWLMQAVVYFKYVLPYCGHDDYSFISFLLFIGATGFIAGAGNIFNDIRDIKTDALHPDKPKLIGHEIRVATAWRWIFWLIFFSILFIAVGWWLYHWSIILIGLFTAGIGLLLFYSYSLKATILTGNVLIGFLCALAVWMTTILVPECGLHLSIASEGRIPLIIGGYIANAFLITILREVIKDKEDALADQIAGIRTIGSLRDTSFRWVFNGLILLTFIVNAAWFHLLRPALRSSDWNLGLFMVFIPLAMITLIFNLPHRSNTYSFLSKLIKVYILFAILLLILWQRG